MNKTARVLSALLLTAAAAQAIDYSSQVAPYAQDLVQMVGDKEVRAEFEKIKSNPAFAGAIEELSKGSTGRSYTRKSDKKEVYLAIPDLTGVVFPQLTKVDGLLPAWIGMQLNAMFYNNRNVEVNRKWGLGFAKAAHDRSFCLGHLYYGDMLVSAREDRRGAKLSWKQGLDSCIGPESTKWYLKTRYLR
ncbi:hypothetical protein ACXWTF_12550 [Thiomicrolovo sp. ZZH C-3]